MKLILKPPPILPLGGLHILCSPLLELFHPLPQDWCAVCQKLWGILGADVIYGSSLSPSLLSPYFAGSLFMLSFYIERKEGKETSLKKVLWGFVIAFKLALLENDLIGDSCLHCMFSHMGDLLFPKLSWCCGVYCHFILLSVFAYTNRPSAGQNKKNDWMKLL